MAVIGVSLANDRHPANVIYYKNHLRYPVRVYPVNPQGGDIQGERVYPHLREIPERVDLAVVAVRAEQVPGVIEECVAARAGGAAVISGGFAESGRNDLQDRVVDIARKTDLLRSVMADSRTRVIPLYVEGSAKNEGREFVKIASRSPKPLNLPDWTCLLLAFSELAMDLQEEVESIDLNPVKGSADQCIVADARIMLA